MQDVSLNPILRTTTGSSHGRRAFKYFASRDYLFRQNHISKLDEC
jgi:hypothetical protein